MKSQKETSASLHQQEDISSPAVATVWVGSSGSKEEHRRGSESNGTAQYVLVSVKKSISDSESSSRRSSETGYVPPPSVVQPLNSAHSRSSSSSSSSSSNADPFSPTSPRNAVDPNTFAQNVTLSGSGGNVFTAASFGNIGNFQGAANGVDAQNLTIAGNLGAAGNFFLPGNANISTVALTGNCVNGQGGAVSGSGDQNYTSYLADAGLLPRVALAGSPAQMTDGGSTFYNGGPFLPAASSSMAGLPQGGCDPSSLLLQQQFALNPALLAASLGPTLGLSQNLDPLQPAAQSQPVGQGSSLAQAQFTPESLSSLQAQASLSQPLSPNLDLLQAQAMLQNLALIQAQGLAQNLNGSHALGLGLSQALPVPPQNLDLLQSQAADPRQQPLTSLSQTDPAPTTPLADSLQRRAAPMGHSFEVLSAMVAASQAMLTSPLQSPTSPVFAPSLVSPQLLLSTGTASLNGLPPRTSADPDSPGCHEPPQAARKTSVPEEPTTTESAEDPSRCVLTSYSVSNGHGDPPSVGGLDPYSPSLTSTSTSPNTDLDPVTSGDGDEHVLQAARAEPRYELPLDRQACLRCGKKVYNMEKLGPVKDALYHRTCFTCAACGSQLNLKTFHHNDRDLADLNVYCLSHKPAARPNPLDSRAVGIRRALTVPRPERVNEQIRGGPEAAKGVHLDSQSVSIRRALNVPAPDLQASIKQREGAWFREQRKYEPVPPRDVVRHDERSAAYQGSRSLYDSSD
ncbi:uncharacterized protein LOC143285192 [Babylonia areolata]|uniref:uncharacterized protein LOC143285192 n=1 Tax=Babylonia areolata TaxID=304850 RepID=UPI003FD69D74